jgi:polyphenol oxidase
VSGALGPGACYLFTDRNGGVSAAPYASLNLGQRVGDDPDAVAANRKLAVAGCGPGVEAIAWMRQVHSSTVRYAGADWPAEPAEPCDGLFTDVAGLVLGVLVADCVPVLVAEPQVGLVGVAHAGRQGMQAGVVSALVAAMASAGARAELMHAVIGPAICGGCYEVPDEMRAEVSATVPAAYGQTTAGTPGLDIRAGVQEQLTAAGVGSVRSDGRCTKESSELFSYRRDGLTGRFAGLVWLAP